MRIGHARAHVLVAWFARVAFGPRLLTQRGSFNRESESSGGDFWGAVATVFVTVAPSHSPRFPRSKSPGGSMAPSPAVLPPLPSLSRSVHLRAVLARPGMRVRGLPGRFPAAPGQSDGFAPQRPRPASPRARARLSLRPSTTWRWKGHRPSQSRHSVQPLALAR